MDSSSPSRPSPLNTSSQQHPGPSAARKYSLLVTFCIAQFIDAFAASAMMSALPELISALDMTASQSTWVISGFQLTFAAFILISGKLSDIYNPKYVFVYGLLCLGIITLGSGFVHDKIALIVLRALSGISASMTIPAALTLLIRVFPELAEQARAITVFATLGAIGGILGLVIGAILVEFASWRWLFWFITLASFPVSGACLFLAPPRKPDSVATNGSSGESKIQRLDLPGISILTAALILFLFAITSGSDAGWGSAQVLAPLLISIAMIVAFFCLGSQVASREGCDTWFYRNFAVLFSTALLPYFWWYVMFDLFITLWQEVYHWSVISSAIHMIPMAVSALLSTFVGSIFPGVHPKWKIVASQLLLVAATILLAFADTPGKYWSHVFPAFLLGSTGSMLMYIHANVAIFRTAPVTMTGVVGAMFNSAMQLGSAVGIAVVTSIQISVDARGVGPVGFRGRRAGLWFVLAVVCASVVGILVFYRTDKEVAAAEADNGDKNINEKMSADQDRRSENKSEDVV